MTEWSGDVSRGQVRRSIIGTVALPHSDGKPMNVL